MNVIVIVMDSMNRHFLEIYGNDWVQTPNISRLASRGTVFDLHFSGSLPTIPARHDLWTGLLEFLWRPWGPVEPGETTVPRQLAGVATRQLITDQFHYFELGGETYHVDFDAWNFIRGHENDPWVTKPFQVEIKGNCTPRYRRNMQYMTEEKQFTSPRTFQAAADWLEDNHHQHERFFLFVDEFDPHEPFHSSEPYCSMYDPDWEGPILFWPHYGPNTHHSPRDLFHLRGQYAGKLTMADAWLGKVLDKLDEHQLWENTMVILTADHGHFLGEHNWVGKGMVPPFRTLANIPLVVAHPDRSQPSRCSALTSAVDVAATVLDSFDIQPRDIDGRSLLPLLTGERTSIRDFALYGWFGGYLGFTDGVHTLLKGPATDHNDPVAVYRLTWNCLPAWGVPVPDERLELGLFNPRTGRITGRIQLTDDEKARLRIHNLAYGLKNGLFNLERDPHEEKNLSDNESLLNHYNEKLMTALHQVGCPPEQYQRLGMQ